MLSKATLTAFGVLLSALGLSTLGAAASASAATLDGLVNTSAV